MVCGSERATIRARRVIIHWVGTVVVMQLSQSELGISVLDRKAGHLSRMALGQLIALHGHAELRLRVGYWHDSGLPAYPLHARFRG
jgi:hypothetical protein